jgi:pyrroloquinoline-quinone synthase
MREHLAQLKERLDFRANPYFAALRDGSFSREDFLETQIQFLSAVAYFSQPMLALAARLPPGEPRRVLLENVADEQGGGDPARSHQATFLELLRRLGADRAAVERLTPGPEVRAFNALLYGLCLGNEPNTALAALGIIEDLFAGISAELGRAMVARGWLPEGEVVHYATHEKLDPRHAEGFYQLLEEPCRQSEDAARQVRQGLELGGYAFLRLYEDLHRARARRA